MISVYDLMVLLTPFSARMGPLDAWILSAL